MKTSKLVFESINEGQEQETKFLFLSLRKFSFSNFIALNQAKEQGTNVIKAQILAVLVFEVRDEVKESETKFLLSHENLPF